MGLHLHLLLNRLLLLDLLLHLLLCHLLLSLPRALLLRGLLLLVLGRGLTGGRASVRQTEQVGDGRQRALVVVHRRRRWRLRRLDVAVRGHLLGGVVVRYHGGRHCV